MEFRAFDFPQQIPLCNPSADDFNIHTFLAMEKKCQLAVRIIYPLFPDAATMAFYQLWPYPLKARFEIDRVLMSRAGRDTWFVPLSMSRAQHYPGSQSCRDNCGGFGQGRAKCWLGSKATYNAIIEECLQCSCFLPVGVFAVQGRNIRRMHRLLQELGGTVRSATTYNKVEKSTTRDLLSGLLNDRGYSEYLRRQFAIASRHGHPLSVCMLAVDGFPNLCAARGRDEGDMMLVEVASLLRRSVRNYDIVARYKGETFCIIFPQTGKEEAFALSEEIRKRISAHSFCQDMYATVSAGVAGYPDDGAENVGILHSKASAALRQARLFCDKAVAYGTAQG